MKQFIREHGNPKQTLLWYMYTLCVQYSTTVFHSGFSLIRRASGMCAHIIWMNQSLRVIHPDLDNFLSIRRDIHTLLGENGFD